MSIGGSSPPYSTLHDFQYPFLDFPPGLSQVDGPYMNEMIGIFIAIGKIEILIKVPLVLFPDKTWHREYAFVNHNNSLIYYCLRRSL